MSSHHPQDALLTQFSLHVHKGDLKSRSFNFSGIQVSKRPHVSYPLTRKDSVGCIRDWEVACSTSDHQGSNFKSCIYKAASPDSSHHPQEVILVQFNLMYVQRSGIAPHSSIQPLTTTDHKYSHQRQKLWSPARHQINTDCRSTLSSNQHWHLVNNDTDTVDRIQWAQFRSSSSRSMRSSRLVLSIKVVQWELGRQTVPCITSRVPLDTVIEPLSLLFRQYWQFVHDLQYPPMTRSHSRHNMCPTNFNIQKLNTLIQCWFNVWQASQTMAQH